MTLNTSSFVSNVTEITVVAMRVSQDTKTIANMLHDAFVRTDDYANEPCVLTHVSKTFLRVVQVAESLFERASGSFDDELIDHIDAGLTSLFPLAGCLDGHYEFNVFMTLLLSEFYRIHIVASNIDNAEEEGVMQLCKTCVASEEERDEMFRKCIAVILNKT